ncbi:MAG: hypothetical protein ACJ8E2_06550 [Bradyrhizobium sp.]
MSDERGAGSHPRRRACRLAPRVAAPDDDNVERFLPCNHGKPSIARWQNPEAVSSRSDVFHVKQRRYLLRTRESAHEMNEELLLANTKLAEDHVQYLVHVDPAEQPAQ